VTDVDQPAGAMSQPAGPTDPTMSYEQARDELVSVVSALEGGGLSLEDSLALWERGEELAAVCQRWLDDARRRLDDVLAAREGHGDD
jgi:exodeoxyribonuclease VII small subunit